MWATFTVDTFVGSTLPPRSHHHHPTDEEPS